MAGRWPYPGDSNITRMKRVALAYRQRLQMAAPDACAALDEQMRRFGQSWVVPRPITADPDAWIPAADAAELAAIGMSALRQLRRRGRIRGRQGRANGTTGRPGWEYQVREVMALATAPRTKKRNGEQ